MRSPVVAPLTRFLIGFPLFVLPAETDRFFAWTIEPPVTAAFLGAAYWGGAFLALVAARERIWARGRISVSPVVVFAVLVPIATYLHLGLFHLDTAYGWAWLVIYSIYPPLLAVLLARQLRTPGGDPPRTDRLPGVVRALFLAQAAVLVPLGIALVAAPEWAGRAWPWTLTPLAGRVVGVWVLGLGVMAAHALWENDVGRVRVALFSYPVLAVLLASVVLRFPVDWSRPGMWVYTAFVASLLVLGAFGWLRARRPSATTR